jgi:hypothetical protein
VNEPIEIDIQYSKSDIINAWRYYRSTFWIVKVGKPLAVLLVLVGIWFYYKYGRMLYLLAFFFFAVDAWFDLLADLRCWLFYRANRKIYNEAIRATVDDTGIHVQSVSYEATRRWMGYSGYAESDDAFILIVSRGSLGVYPKRAFQSLEQQNRFRQLLVENICDVKENDKVASG